MKQYIFINKYKASGGIFLDNTLDKLLLHRLWGNVILFFVLGGILYVLGKLVAVDLTGFLFDGFFVGDVAPKITAFLEKVLNKDGILFLLLIGQYGVINMGVGYLLGIIIPIVACFYFFMTLLEESGYISRMAKLSDNSFKSMGLSGRMTVPIILGFGCITMAFVSISSLKSEKERIIASTLLALTVPCSAQFGIIIGQLAHYGLSYLAVYFVVLIIIFVITAVILTKIIKDDGKRDVLTLTPLKLPSISKVINTTIDKSWEFLSEAFPVFVVASIVLTLMAHFGLLNKLYELMSPLTVGVLKLPAEASAAFILSMIRREFGVVSLLTLSLSPQSMLVALITITLLIPCLSAVFVLFKQRGVKEASLICIFCTVTAFAVGGILARIIAV